MGCSPSRLDFRSSNSSASPRLLSSMSAETLRTSCLQGWGGFLTDLVGFESERPSPHPQFRLSLRPSAPLFLQSLPRITLPAGHIYLGTSF